MKLNSWFILGVIAIMLLSCKQQIKDKAVDQGIYYTCSMDPQIVQQKPGKCPICHMELTKMNRSAEVANSIKLSDEQIRLAGISIMKISGRPGSHRIRGKVTIDENKQSVVTSRVSGRIEKLYRKTEGEKVKKGEKLFELYSEELENSLRQYRLLKEKAKSLSSSDVNYEQLAQGAKDRLLISGVSERQIETMLQGNTNTVPYFSPADGILWKIDVTEGAYVSEGTVMMTLVDLSSVWISAEVNTRDLEMFTNAMEVKVRVEGNMDQELSGKVIQVNHVLMEQSQLGEVRIEIKNQEQRMLPGMRATVGLPSTGKGMSIPANALVTESDHYKVWVKNEDGSFSFRNVKVSGYSGNQVEISEGLQGTEELVMSGVYLLNSEYILRRGVSGSQAALQEPELPKNHQH